MKITEMSDDDSKLLSEMQTKIEELDKYKINNIDKFEEKFSEKNKPDADTYYQYLNYQVSPELHNIKRQFYNFDDNSKDDGNYLKIKEKFEGIVKGENISAKVLNLFFTYSDLYNSSLASLSTLDRELIIRITNPHLKIQYERSVAQTGERSEPI